MHRNWISIGAVLGFLGVALGAFGAHGLKKVASPEQLSWWGTAVDYHLWHAPVLILLGILQKDKGGGDLVGWLLLGGVTVFSGTLYAMALGGPTVLGAVTPIGGVLLIAGWLRLAWFGR